MKPSIAVVGSLNIDMVGETKHLPSPGETVRAHRLRKAFGGKGANQAIAASRAGATVRMIGCLGADADGAAYRTRLTKFAIDDSGIMTAPKALTGTALIGVAASGENQIIVAPEANGKLTAAWVRRHRRLIESADVLLLQWETPMTCVMAALQLANRAGVAVVMNPSPISSEFKWGEVWVDYLVVNESEAAAIFRYRVATLAVHPTPWWKRMKQLAIGTLIVTRGSASVHCLSKQAEGHKPTMLTVATQPVNPVDTVGAGDTFAGVFAAAIAKNVPLAEAIHRANQAAAKSILRRGAQPA